MFDYKGSPMPNQTTTATNALTDAATAAANAAGQLAQGAKDSIAKRLGQIDTNEMKKKIIRKVETTDLRGGSKRTRKRRRTKNHRHSNSNRHSQ